MIYIIKCCVKCMYCFQKCNCNKTLCRPNMDPKKNNDIESCDSDEENNDNMIIEHKSFTIYNFLQYIYCELYEYILKLIIIITYIFIFYIIYELYRS